MGAVSVGWAMTAAACGSDDASTASSTSASSTAISDISTTTTDVPTSNKAPRTTEGETTTTAESRPSTGGACDRLSGADLARLGIEDTIFDSMEPKLFGSPDRDGSSMVSTCSWGIEGLSSINVKVSVREPVAPNTIERLRTQSDLGHQMAEFSPVGDDAFVHLQEASTRSTKRRFTLLAFGDAYVEAEGVVDTPDEAARLADLEFVATRLLGTK